MLCDSNHLALYKIKGLDSRCYKKRKLMLNPNNLRLRFNQIYDTQFNIFIALFLMNCDIYELDVV
jgi:hypothetical protein